MTSDSCSEVGKLLPPAKADSGNITSIAIATETRLVSDDRFKRYTGCRAWFTVFSGLVGEVRKWIQLRFNFGWGFLNRSTLQNSIISYMTNYHSNCTMTTVKSSSSGLPEQKSVNSASRAVIIVCGEWSAYSLRKRSSASVPYPSSPAPRASVRPSE